MNGTNTAQLSDSAATNQTSELVDSTLLFGIYLVVNAIEYAGLSSVLPILKVTRLSTIGAWLLALLVLKRVGLKGLKEYRQSRLVLVLLIWTGASVIWAIVQSYVPTTFRYTADYVGLMIVTMYLVDRPSRIKATAVMFSLALIWVFINNIDLLNSGTRLVRFRGAYFMGDGNDLSWAFATLLLFPCFLVLGPNGLLLKLLGLVSSICVVAAIVLTQSRGATLALGAIAVYFWLAASKRKFLTAVGIASICLSIVAFAPAGYLDRVNSIQDYEDDNSAQGRIRAWKASVQMAFDYPLGVGAGNFPSAYGRYYRDPNAVGWGAARWMNAHSVYFKVLGEYGFGGLLLLVIIIAGNLVDNQKALWSIRKDPSRYLITDAWPVALNVGQVGYAVAAIFLGGVTYPHLFLVTGLALGCKRMVDAAAVAREAAPVDDHLSALSPVDRWAALQSRRSSTLARARFQPSR
jgi:probable O-glycosylation ligase (exosortase A-associated)